MNKFTLGALAGMSSLAVAVPLMLQGVSAASTSSASIPSHVFTPPTQACLAAQVDLEQARIDNFDTMSAQRKTELQKRHDALATVAAITDDTQRADALKKLRTDGQAARKAEPTDVPAAITTAQAAVKAACGNTMMPAIGDMMGSPGSDRGFGGPMHGGKGPMGAQLATKLGMTETDLKAALDSGKTIEQIAEEKGITLPARPAFGHHKENTGMMPDTDGQ